VQRITHQTIKKVSQDIEKIRFNTMIAALMEFTNYLTKIKEAGSVSEADWRKSTEILLLLLAPTAPHLTEELWQLIGNQYSIHNQQWPDWDEKLAADGQVTLVVQVNGKLRDRIIVPASITENEALWLAEESHKVEGYLKGKDIIKKVYIRGKLVNLVVK